MHYEITDKSHKIALIIPIILFILSPHSFVEANKPKENKTVIYQTWSEVQKAESSSWKVEETKEVGKCDQECKINTLIKLGITSNISNLIVSECKEWAIDPVHCIKVASAIVINESGGGKSNACKTRYNCFWIWSGKVTYTSHQEMMVNWIQKYNRYWFKAKDMSYFYATTWNIPPSRYCMSEDSSWSSLGCSNWLRIANWIFTKLNKLF